MRKQFEELHPLFDLEKDEQGEYMCVLTRVTWLGFELGKKTLQAEIDQLKAQGGKIQKQFNFLLDKNIRDESAHASLKLRVMRVSHLMDKAAENGTECVDIGSLYDALIKDGDLDQSLRGEHENSN